MKTSVKIYKRMLGFLKPYMHLFLFAILLSVAIVTLEGMAVWFLGTLPQTLFQPQTVIIEKPQIFDFSTINAYLKYFTCKIVRSEKINNPLAVVCLLIIISYTIKNILFYINKLVVRNLNLNVVKDMRNLLYGHVLMLPVSYYDRNKSGRIVSHIINDVAQVNKSLADTLNKSVMDPLELIFFVTMLFIINFKLTLLVFLIYPGLILLIVQIGKTVKRRSRRVLDKFSGLVSVLTETIQGVRAVKMFNMNTVEKEKFAKENKRYIKASFRAEQINAVLVPLTETLAMYVTATLLWYGGNQSLAGSPHFTPEDFFRFLFFLFSSYRPLKALGVINNNIQTGIAAAERVIGLLNIETEPLTEKADQPNPIFNHDVVFDNVSFKYPGCTDDVLKNLSLTVSKGSVVAIVGSSGAGKTTVLDLLPRFYTVTDGSIRIDGQDINSMNLISLRNLFGIVSQETILFNDTIQNNIAYGSMHATPNEIHAAAAAANAQEFIERLPQGMDTVIGEQGAMLSGGQRQRLSIARALLRNPQILILDEATSALDTESERLVQLAIDNLISNRTTFVVAHRLSTIKHADTIVVLEGGKIIEQGSHEELLALNKRYKYFYDIQFSAAK